VNLVLISLAGILGLVFLWGVVSPRSEWYSLVGWTRSDPRATEPGSAAYAAGRFVSLIGLLALLTIAINSAVGDIKFDQQVVVRPTTATERVWGAPRSYVVDRVFMPLSAIPEGLVEQSITGYQLVNGPEQSPEYLFEAGKIRQAGLAAQPGFLGVPPLAGAVALDTADLVVHVRGDDRCIPQKVVVVLVEGAVQIGVFFGQPSPADGSNADVSNCDPGPPIARTKGYLIPVDLAAPLGERVVQSLDGTPLNLVPLPTS